MKYDELFQIVVDQHFDLVKLDSLKFRRETAPHIVQQYDENVERLYTLRRELFREILDTNTEEFKTHAASLQKINVELDKTIGDVTKIAETLQNLVKFIAAVEEIISLASGIKSVSFLAKEKALVAKEKAPVAKEKAPLFLIEEVLHGVELTREKLIITVATGGCTNKGSFRFDVNKGATPYMVTVYRIEPDDCKEDFEPESLSYSREELGIDGPVEFILRNKIGNTSQHRLNISPSPQDQVEWLQGIRISTRCGESLQSLLTIRTPTLKQKPIGDDFITIEAAGLKGDKLIIDVIYGGGCREHTFQLNWDGSFLKSNPAQAVLELSHNANGDPCRMLLRERLQFDLSVIIENPSQYVLRVTSGVTEIVAHSPVPFFP
jgi:hypothetical protein